MAPKWLTKAAGGGYMRVRASAPRRPVARITITKVQISHG